MSAESWERLYNVFVRQGRIKSEPSNEQINKQLTEQILDYLPFGQIVTVDEFIDLIVGEGLIKDPEQIMHSIEALIESKDIFAQNGSDGNLYLRRAE